jgi:hypothetical protein
VLNFIYNIILYRLVKNGLVGLYKWQGHKLTDPIVQPIVEIATDFHQQASVMAKGTHSQYALI